MVLAEKMLDEMVVDWADGVSEHHRSTVRDQFGIVEFKPIGETKLELWYLPNSKMIGELIQQVVQLPEIEQAEPNYRYTPHLTPNEASFSSQLWGIEKMKFPEAWEITTGSRDVVVAILDDSLDINHPDLIGNIWENTYEIPNNGIDDDGNGYVDDVHGWDFSNNDNDPSPDLDEEHGTMVAGVLGAVGNNGIGTSGAAWEASIMPLKFSFDVASGVEAALYAVEQGADILVASFGGPAYSFSHDFALQQLHKAGVLVVTSAGNNHGDNDRVPDFPSNIDYPNIISVAASQQDDTLTEWSNHGQYSVDLMAPGESIYTTYTSPTTKQPKYITVSGTSFSAPYVAGVAALVKANNPEADFRDLKGHILSSVDPIEGGHGYVATNGRVNAYNALIVNPQSVLLVRSVELSNLIGDGDIFVDRGELLNLSVIMENIWKPSKEITAVLTSESQLVDILWDEAGYPPLDPVTGPASSAAEEPFTVYFRPELDGHHTIPFKLELFQEGEMTTVRYFQLEVGALRNAVTYSETLQQSSQDDFHSFHINFPQGATGLSIETNVAGDVDIDLLAAEGEFPQFELDTDEGTSIGPMTIIDGNWSENEQILIQDSAEETIQVVVVNFSQETNQHYTIRATYHLSEEGSMPSVVQPTGFFPIDTTSELAFPDHEDVVVQGYLLHPGWNLISLPAIVEKTSARRLLDQFPEVSSIWEYDQSGWRSALQSLPWEMNTLKEFQAGKGYWINVQSDMPINVVIVGVGISSPELVSGWNLFGVSEEIVDIPYFLSSNSADSIWSWGQGWWKSYHADTPLFLNSITTLEPGKGYYVHKQ